MPADPTNSSSFQDFSPDEFLAAATKLFETARPWIGVALAEHAAHPEAEPGNCRFCALSGALARNFEPFAGEASRMIGKFADEMMADLMRLVEELMGGARAAVTAVALDYASTVSGAGAADDSRDPSPASAPGPTGYERIDIRLPEEPAGAAE